MTYIHSADKPRAFHPVWIEPNLVVELSLLNGTKVENFHLDRGENYLFTHGQELLLNGQRRHNRPELEALSATPMKLDGQIAHKVAGISQWKPEIGAPMPMGHKRSSNEKQKHNNKRRHKHKQTGVAAAKRRVPLALNGPKSVLEPDTCNLGTIDPFNAHVLAQACNLNERLLPIENRSKLCYWFPIGEILASRINGTDADERLVEAELHLFKLRPQELGSSSSHAYRALNGNLKARVASKIGRQPDPPSEQDTTTTTSTVTKLRAPRAASQRGQLDPSEWATNEPEVGLKQPEVFSSRNDSDSDSNSLHWAANNKVSLNFDTKFLCV